MLIKPQYPTSTSTHYSLSMVKDALMFISPDCPREKWVKVGQAIHSEFGDTGFELYDQWSQGGNSYVSRDTFDTYKSFRQTGGITIKTLFYMARQGGYVPSVVLDNSHYKGIKKTVQDVIQCTAALVKEDDEAMTRHVNTAAWCAGWYPELPDATPDNEYLKKKQIPSTPGLKQASDGALVVPLFDADGNISTLQFIRANGKKGFKKDGSFKGCFFCVGGQPTSDLLICEGVATGISLNMAMMVPTFVAFSKDNLAAVAQHLRQLYPAARMTICADNDRVSDRNGGVEAARKAAEVGALVVVPQFVGAEGTDFDDLRMLEGLDSVCHQIQATWSQAILPALDVQPHAEPPKAKYRLMSASELRRATPMQWRLAGVLPCVGLAAIFGPSGSGKSFIALDFAAAIAGGAEFWFDRRVSVAPVTYVALEGEQGMEKRVSAWSQHHCVPVPDKLRFISQPFNLRSTDVDELAAAVLDAGGKGGVVIIDTLNRASAGADENSSSHMGELITAATHLQILTEGLVVLVHHTGKDENRGMRGHSSLYAALDGAMEVHRDAAGRWWSVAKAKDDADGLKYSFDLEVVEVGRDEHGDAITSCIVVPGETGDTTAKVKKTSGARQAAAVRVLTPAIKAGAVGIVGVPDGQPAIDYEAAIELVAKEMPSASNKRRYDAGAVIDKLIVKGFYERNEQWLWMK